MDNKKLAGMIRKAGKIQRTAEFECPYAKGFFVEITYASRMVLQEIRDASQEIGYNTREREERLNEDKLNNEYVDKIIQGWRGLTPKKLAKIIPGVDYDENNADTEIKFSRDVALALLETSLDFNAWVVDTAGETENFSEINQKKDEEYENLKK
jgi:hypothetical protein